MYTPHQHFRELLLSTVLSLNFGGKKEMQRKKCKERKLGKRLFSHYIYRKNKSTLGIQRKKKIHFMKFPKSEFIWVKSEILHTPLKFLLQHIFNSESSTDMYMPKKTGFTPSLITQKEQLSRWHPSCFYFSLKYFSRKTPEETDLLRLPTAGRKRIHCPFSRKIFKH